MRYILLFLMLIICSLHDSYAEQQSPDTLATILNSRDNSEQQQKKLISLCYDRFLISEAYDKLAAPMVDSLAEYNLSGQQELKNFIQIIIYRRNSELEKADKLLNASISIALQNEEKMFLYHFYLNQAYVQTDLGNPLKAVHFYRLTRKVAEELNNQDFFITTDIGISDIYMNIGLYSQALMYLEQAQITFNEKKTPRPSTQKLIYLNKGEIYFKLGQEDSLRHYSDLASKGQNIATNPDRDLRRLFYFQLILKKEYAIAIPVIQELLNTGNQYYKNFDRWYLAESYYHSGQVDLALEKAIQLIANPQLISSEIRLKAYKLLASIAQDKNQIKQANQYLQLALKQSEDYTQRLNKIGDLASDLRLDRMESGYHARNQLYQRERIILVMAVIAAVLVVIVILVSYRNIKQKSRFQSLLHQARSKELAFINSHQIRRPLANILGLCSLTTDEQLTLAEIQQYFQQVYHQAKEMDDKLKEVEKKLNTQT